jgi:acyl carrier protein
MIALEDTFDIEFLDSMLKRSVFESVGSISAALQKVGVAA